MSVLFNDSFFLWYSLFVVCALLALIGSDRMQRFFNRFQKKIFKW